MLFENSYTNVYVVTILLCYYSSNLVYLFIR